MSNWVVTSSGAASKISPAETPPSSAIRSAEKAVSEKTTLET